MSHKNTLNKSRRFRIYGISAALTELLSKIDLRTIEYRDYGKVNTSVTLFFKKSPYPTGEETHLLFICFMFMLVKHIYPRRMDNGWTKIVPVLEMLSGKVFRSYKDDVICKAVCSSIPLYDETENQVIPLEDVAKDLYQKLCILKDNYKSHYIYALSINVYSGPRKPVDSVFIPTDEEVLSLLDKKCILEDTISEVYYKSAEEQIEMEEKKGNSKFPDYITKVVNTNRLQMEEYKMKMKSDPQYKGKPPKPSVFLVGDLETIQLKDDPRNLIDDVVGKDTSQNNNHNQSNMKPKEPRHYAYAASWMTVEPDKVLDKLDIRHSFTYDYSKTHHNFYDQSELVLTEFINSIVREGARLRKTPIIYFHNMSKFDGFLLAQHLYHKHKEFEIINQTRNNTIYEISVYKKLYKNKEDSSNKKMNKKEMKKIMDKRLLFRMRCSLLILPDSLDSLAKQMCPHLGGKEKLDHTTVTLESLNNKEAYKQYKSYLAQDILLLGVILQKVQDFFWKEFLIDIVSKRTIAALALGIFRMDYYDDQKHRMYIPNQNADKFLRRAYYGGHSDVYKPKGENLYAYDVNSLYPSVMVGRKMPGGRPVWHRDLRKHKLADIFGFVEAFVIVGNQSNRPFLPTKHPVEKTLVFPDGTIFGTYFTEELKYAEKLGYKVIITCGYLFEPIDSPFDLYVNDLYTRRKEAKIALDTVSGYLYKLLLNSLYGRLAISPESHLTIVLNDDEMESFVRRTPIKGVMVIGKDINVISYMQNIYDNRGPWQPPMNSCPQMSAAITGYGRIDMYPFISRDDCLYTDTDSVILSNPLPEELVSQTELGKFKLEYGGPIREGYFLSSKCYFLVLDQTRKDSDGKETPVEVIKYKGVPKGLVTPDFFRKLYENLDHTEEVTYENPFRINYDFLTIHKKQSRHTLQMNSNKRKPVFDRNEKWVGTKPVRFGLEQLKVQLSESTTSDIIILELAAENAELKKRLNGIYESDESDDDSY